MERQRVGNRSGKDVKMSVSAMARDQKRIRDARGRQRGPSHSDRAHRSDLRHDPRPAEKAFRESSQKRHSEKAFREGTQRKHSDEAFR